MKLIVVSKQVVATAVVKVTFRAAEGTRLQRYGAGAHIVLHLGTLERRYSLTSSPATSEQYEICVQRASPSRGGSDFVHDVIQPGEVVEVDGPFNGFPLRAAGQHVVLLAGGIGVTPFFSMASELEGAGTSHEVHYSVRSRDRMLPTAGLGKSLTTYVEVEGQVLDLRRVLTSAPPGSSFYACGPRGMLEAIRQIAAVERLPAGSIHMESFGAARRADDAPVDVRLERSGLNFRVEPGQSILDAAVAAGAWATHECNRGECGSCYVEVLEGAVDHRDVCLNAEQRVKGMCPCVSWGTGSNLVLDM